jgi:hypothetical protein
MKDNSTVVINSLQDFSNTVEALKYDKTSQDDVELLMTTTKQIIDLLVAGTGKRG